jgi:hypothetical protein
VFAFFKGDFNSPVKILILRKKKGKEWFIDVLWGTLGDLSL